MDLRLPLIASALLLGQASEPSAADAREEKPASGKASKAAPEPPIVFELPPHSSAAVVARPLAARLEITFRPRRPSTIGALREHPAVTSAAYFPLPKGRGERLVLGLREPRWIATRREPTRLVLELRKLPGPRPIESGAMLYPRWTPMRRAEVPAGAECPDVAEVLLRLRREANAVHAKALMFIVHAGGPCAATARLAFGEAALRLRRADLAVGVLLRAPESPVRDGLLAVAAHEAGDFGLASEAFTRLGRLETGEDLAVAGEVHLAAGHLERGLRWMRAARPLVAERMKADLELRIVDALLLLGRRAEAIAELRRLRARFPEREADIDVLRLAAANPSVAIVRLLGGDGAPDTAIGDLYRALSAQLRGDEAALAAASRSFGVRTGPRGLGAAVSDLLTYFELERVRSLRARHETRGVALAFFERPELLRDEAHGLELCGAAMEALEAIGLSLRLESVARGCLATARASGRERETLRALASAQSMRGDEKAAARTLRFLASRDPLGASQDGRFWLAFGRALVHEGRLPDATRALRRAIESKAIAAAREARERLGALADAAGHRFFARALLRDAGPRHPAKAHASGANAEALAVASKLEGGKGAAVGARSPVATIDEALEASWKRLGVGLRALETTEEASR